MPKLRTYKKFKLTLETENYVKSNMQRPNRSLLAKFRTGTFPINIELGRHRRLPVAERTCPSCPQQIEDEYHFLLECANYRQERLKLYKEFQESTGEELEGLEQDEKFFLLMQVEMAAKPVSRFLQNALYKRNKR